MRFHISRHFLFCSWCFSSVFLPSVNSFDFLKKMDVKLSDDFISRPVKPKSEVTSEELAEKEREEFRVGPFSLLTRAVKYNKTVLITCCNNKKLLVRVGAFDRHFNMVLEDVREMWVEHPRKEKGNKKPVNRDRYISKMFLRGDSVILVFENAVKVTPVAPKTWMLSFEGDRSYFQGIHSTGFSQRSSNDCS